MALTDQKSGSFFTTGWKLFVLGAILAIIGVSTDSKLGSFGVFIGIVGYVLVIVAIIIWIIKGFKKLTQKS